MPSQEAVRSAAALALGRRYLILDEMSMISRPFFSKSATILAMISNALGATYNGRRPFGGLNVILVGDFHQFPPVAAKV